MIITKITGSCSICKKIYQLIHSAPIHPSKRQIKSLQSSERCPDCSDIHLRTVLNFHWTGTKDGSTGMQSDSDFSYDLSESQPKSILEVNKKVNEMLLFIDCYPFTESQLVNVLKEIKKDMGLRLQDSCDAVAIALYETINEGSLNIVTDNKNKWIHMLFQYGNNLFDLDGKHSKNELINRCNKTLIKEVYFVKEISYEHAYELMDWRIEEEKNYLKNELYMRVKAISESYEEFGKNIVSLI